MKKYYTHIAMMILFTVAMWGQTTVFSDDFSSNTSATYTTSGAIGASAWSVNRLGADWGARRNTSPEHLEITNDVGATANANGWSFSYTSTSSFSSPYNTTLSSNSGIVTWYFNIRVNRSNLAGFAAGSYGLAFIIGSTGNDVNASSTHDGYALILGNSSTPDPFKFGYFTDGLDGFTALITSNTTGLTNIGTNYYSVKITYDPSSNTWELFLRDDGSSNFSDPTSGSVTSQGTSVNSTYTSTSLTHLGGYWQGSTAASQFASFDNVVVTVISAGTPTIVVDPSSLTGFSYVDGSGPSASQPYNLSGSNLTPSDDNLTVTAPTNFEVSTDDINFSPSVNVSYSGNSLSATPVYVRLKSGLSAGSYNSETTSNAGGGATTQNVTVSGTVYKVEPTNHTSSFASAAGTPDHSAIDLSWTDASGGTTPDGYLIKASTTSFAAIIDPIDGTAESNETLVKNVTQGTQSVTFVSLDASTTYYFKIYPYTNSSSNINYKTDGVVPTTSTSTAAAPPAVSLLIENFSFSGLLTDNGWSAHSGAGTNSISTTTGLTYSGYANSGIGNAALIGNTGGEDVNIGLSAEQNTNGESVYLSFLVNVNDAATDKSGDYFFNTGDRVDGSNFTAFAGRVFARIVSDNVNFGISNTGTPTYGSTNFSKNTTYLLVVKYTINTSGNDEVKLWVLSSGVPGTEGGAGTAEVTNSTTAGTDVIDAIAIRQGSATTQPQVVIDGIRVADGWPESPLPVELTSFTAAAKSRGVELSWCTATETNNYGFEIEKRMKDELGIMNWRKIGFVEGHGTTNAPKRYSFVDGSANGTVVYRLKQIDRDGSFEYSNQVEVTVAAPAEFALMQNHPNPFNPATAINYTLPVAGHVSLKVYDMLGKEVAVLVNAVQDAGAKIIQYDASQLPSGIYFYTLRTNNFTATKKMLLVK